MFLQCFLPLYPPVFDQAPGPHGCTLMGGSGSWLLTDTTAPVDFCFMLIQCLAWPSRYDTDVLSTANTPANDHLPATAPSLSLVSTISDNMLRLSMQIRPRTTSR